jgi:predicted CoA-substrate-specific enzyme activase
MENIRIIGVDAGASTLKVVVIEPPDTILMKEEFSHKGSPLSCIDRVMETILKNKKYGYSIGFTGCNARLLQEHFGTDINSVIDEIPALQQGVSFLNYNAPTILDIGAASAKLIRNDDDGFQFATTEGCAGGTGSFLEQQIKRMGQEINAYEHLDIRPKRIPRISGHCAVFAKTDIIHRQQEGYTIDEVLWGICYATVRNLKSTLLKGVINAPLLLCGGVSRNRGIIAAIEDLFKLNPHEVWTDPDAVFVSALGAACLTKHKKSEAEELLIRTIHQKENKNLGVNKETKLSGEGIQIPMLVKHEMKDEHCILGIDVGSTSVNLVLIDAKGSLLDYLYLRTKGEPKKVVDHGIEELKKKYHNKINIKSIGITGSGRIMIGKQINADVIRDEITCQAKAAVWSNSDVDTVFEIGGQDSKYIQVKNGTVVNFQMNKICAAGTGSFLEEQAEHLGVPIHLYGELALQGKSPAKLGERCTVFIENNITGSLAKNVSKADILAGLCRSVVANYCSKVIGSNPVGRHILLQGGVCYNKAVVAAFREVYGERVTVSPVFPISGAYGAALIAMETGAKKENPKKTEYSYLDYRQETDNLFQVKAEKDDKEKKRIGIPLVLSLYRYAPLICTYFQELGFTPVVSGKTTSQMIETAAENAPSDTCYPIKLVYGHINALIEKEVDYLFIPRMYQLGESSPPMYGCMFMQALPEMIQASARKFGFTGEFITADLGKFPPEKELLSMEKQMGKRGFKAAYEKGMNRLGTYMRELNEMNQKLQKNIQEDAPVIVLLARNYNIQDQVLNMGILEELEQRNCQVISAPQLPIKNILQDNEHYPYGAHMIAAARYISRKKHYYCIYLTSHGCAQDAVTAHIVQKEMGNKPMLSIELDEHFSKVGLITRIEAFLQSIDSREKLLVDLPPKKTVPFYTNAEGIERKNMFSKEKMILIPYMYPYSILYAAYLRQNGFQVLELKPLTGTDLNEGYKITSAKEYITFAAAAGLIEGRKTELPSQMPLLTGEGGEADAIYAQVLGNKAQKKEIEIINIQLEHLLMHAEKKEAKIISILLAGDLVLLSPPEARKAMLKQYLEKIPSLEVLINSFKRAREMWIKETTTKKIAIVGDLSFIYRTGITDALIDELEKNNRTILSPSLAEVLVFLAYDKMKEYNTPHKALLEGCFDESVMELIYKADNILPRFQGGMGRYRAAKVELLKEEADTIIEFAPMYENTQTVLDVIRDRSSHPVLTLRLEGDNIDKQSEQLKTFLYYLDS